MQYLQGNRLASSRLARSGKKSEFQIQYRLKRSLNKFIATASWATPPQGVPLIAVADAIWQRIGNEQYTLFIILLKPLNSSQAIICPPLLRKGNETLGWPYAFKKLSKDSQQAIFALVCDGNVGLVSFARHHGWAIQRCHAHLRRFLNNYISRGPQSRHRVLGDEINKLTTIMLTSNNQLEIARTALKLKEIYHVTKSRGVRKVISGFIKHIGEYRTYLDYPEVNLPITTNAVESLNSMIRSLLKRSRGFRSPDTFFQWTTAFLLNKKTITCNGNFSTK